MTFTTDLVTKAIRSCSKTKTFGPDKLSIFHLKHLGPRATAYLTALFFNDSVNSSRIPAIWKSSIVIPILKPGKDTSQGTSYRPISLICPAAKVLEALILPTVNVGQSFIIFLDRGGLNFNGGNYSIHQKNLPPPMANIFAFHITIIILNPLPRMLPEKQSKCAQKSTTLS